MHNLRMKLHPVEPADRVLDRSIWACRSNSSYMEAFRNLINRIPMAHPDTAFIRDSGEESRISVHYIYILQTIFLLLRTCNIAAEHFRHHLQAIADTKDRNSKRENCSIRTR